MYYYYFQKSFLASDCSIFLRVLAIFDFIAKGYHYLFINRNSVPSFNLTGSREHDRRRFYVQTNCGICMR